MDTLSGHPGSVLVIDDDLLMRELLVALLEIEGIRIDAAESGADALATLTGPTGERDVVLTDLHMPDTDIAELAPKLRAARKHGALLLGMSGSPAGPEDLALLDGFLLKPFSTEEFFAAVLVAQEGGAAAMARTAQAHKAPLPGNEIEIAVLDMQIYRKMAASLKPPALVEMYRITLDDAGKRIAIIRAAHAQGDHGTCRREAHAIKGGCGMVGAMELRAMAAAMETGAPADTPALAKMEEACRRLQNMLDALPLITFGAS